MDKLAGFDVLFVMAADAEYGPRLRARIAPLMCGVGPVEAAIRVTQALAAQRPDLVVSLGSAGSDRLEQAAVYQISSVSYRDMDASPLGFAPGVTPFLDLPARLDLPHRIPGLPVASIATGASIVSGAAYAKIDAEMVDMETFAILRACQTFGVPLIGLRGISDGAEELSHLSDWTRYLRVIDGRLADAVNALESALAAEKIAL